MKSGISLIFLILQPVYPSSQKQASTQEQTGNDLWYMMLVSAAERTGAKEFYHRMGFDSEHFRGFKKHLRGYKTSGPESY